MEKEYKDILKITPLLHKYVQFINAKIPRNGKLSIPKDKRYSVTFMDLLLKHKSNIEGLLLVINQLNSNILLKIPAASILRTISSDTITSIYLLTFLSSNITEEQITFYNELNCMELEFFETIKEMTRTEKSLELHKNSEIKTELIENSKYNDLSIKEIHRNSNPIILTERYFTNRTKLLSEKYKINRITLFSNYKEFQFSYLCYKIFSQYYHYSPAGGNLSRKIMEEEYYYSLVAISQSIKAVSYYTGLIEIIDIDFQERAFNYSELINKAL